MSMLRDSYMKLIYGPNYFKQDELYEQIGSKALSFTSKETIMKLIYIHLWFYIVISGISLQL